jgi:ribose transport system substrate-binding protein
MKSSRLLTTSVVAVAATLLTVACSSTTPGTGGGGGGDSKTIGFSQATVNHPFRVAMVDGNVAYAKEKGYKMVVTDAQDDAAKQIADIQSLMAQNVKVLIISPDQSAPLNNIVKQAMDAGIKVITADRSVDTPVTEHIGGDNLAIGKEAADYLAENLGDKGNVIEIQGTAGASATIDRQKSFDDEMSSAHPNIKIIATQYADYSRQPAQKYMEDMLRRFPSGEIQAVYAHNDEMALGAIQALKEANRLDEVKVISIDGQNAGIDAVKDGSLLATFAYPYCAPQAAEQAIKAMKGEDIPEDLVLDAPRIDADNVDEWVGKGF